MTVRILQGDCREVLKTLPDQSVHCVVTSPPYFGLRDYGVAGQIGLEASPWEFVAGMVEVFREVRRVLRDDGTLWLNLGDSYAGSGRGGNPEAGTKQSTNRGSQTVGVIYGREDASAERERLKVQNARLADAGIKPKDLIGIPWMVAFALRADGWYLRSDIIWHKPNPMPESVTDRPTSAHEHIFLLSKSQRYHYDAAAIREAAIYSGLPGQDESGFKNAADFNGKHAAHPHVRNEKGRRKRGLPPRHAQYESSDQAGLDHVGRGAGRNARNVWTVATRPFAEAHFATFPPRLIEPCIKAGSPVGGIILDPFGGSGTTALVADRLQRSAILIELNPEYVDMARRRVIHDAPLLVKEAAE